MSNIGLVENRIRIYNVAGLKDRRRDLRQRSTETERILWERIRNNKLGQRFKRQYSVRGYVMDFYCPRKKLAIELLGSVHLTADSKKYDKYRKEYLENFEIKIIEIWNDEIKYNLGKVIDRISDNIAARPLSLRRRGERKG